MKSCLISIITKESQIKTKIRFHLTAIRMGCINNKKMTSTGEELGKLKLRHTVERKVKWFRFYGRECGYYSKVKIELSYIAEMLCLGIYTNILKSRSWGKKMTNIQDVRENLTLHQQMNWQRKCDYIHICLNECMCVYIYITRFTSIIKGHILYSDWKNTIFKFY